MSDRPTPLTDAIEDTAARNPPIWKHARDLERKLAEAREALEKIEDHFINGHDTYADHEFMGEIAQEALARIDENQQKP